MAERLLKQGNEAQKIPRTKKWDKKKEKEGEEGFKWNWQKCHGFLSQNIENLLSANTRASEADILHLE